MDNLRNRNSNDHLSVNKMGKNIKKSPVHQPSYNDAARQQPQPQVYNINKNDFRNFVQRLTGSPSHESLPRPHHNPSRPSMRLQKIRPPPLTPMNRPEMSVHAAAPPQAALHQPVPAPSVPYNNNLVRGYGDSTWANRAESPISAYMRYLQANFIDSGSLQEQTQDQPLPQLQAQATTGQNQTQPSPWMNAQSFLPSPTIFPSPTGFLNLLSPLSPYPLLSPGNPSQFMPNFTFSPLARSGVLGHGPPGLPSPRSPHLGFPLSPSGFFSNLSPRWREN